MIDYHYDFDAAINSLYQPGDDPIGHGQNIYFHPADVYSGPFYFRLIGNNTTSGQPPTGDTPRTPNTPTSDPCAGRKGQLDFSPASKPGWGMNNHIFPRHISTKSKWVGKSKYVFFPWQTTAGDYKDRVKSLDQYTFVNGKFAVDGNVVVYTYAFFGIEAGDDKYIANQVGIDGRTGAKTNVNTVVVSIPNCASVITSYPGLPKQFTQSDIPGAMFRTDGWSIMHRSHF